MPVKCDFIILDNLLNRLVKKTFFFYLCKYLYFAKSEFVSFMTIKNKTFLISLFFNLFLNLSIASIRHFEKKFFVNTCLINTKIRVFWKNMWFLFIYFNWNYVFNSTLLKWSKYVTWVHLSICEIEPQVLKDISSSLIYCFLLRKFCVQALFFFYITCLKTWNIYVSEYLCILYLSIFSYTQICVS